MRPVVDFTFTLPANGYFRQPCSGSSFKILAATGLVEVRGDWGSISSCAVGQGITDTEFKYLGFKNLTGAPNTLRIICGDAGFLDNITGQVSVTSTVSPSSAAFSSAAANVGTASSQLLAANANRQYFGVQNNDPASSIYVNPTGAAATKTNCVIVRPGQLWEPPVAPKTAITVIGDAATTAVVVMEA